MNTRITRLAAVSAVTAAAFFGAAQEARATLLSYWNFNNVGPAYLSGNGTLGSFSTSGAAYGEAYTQVNNATAGTLGGNTANSTAFSSSAIKIDFANLGTVATPLINGKVATAYTAQGQTNTTVGGYGVFADDTTNRVAGDSTTGGSLIIMNPSGTTLGKYITFSLSSAGYNALTLSFATRMSGGGATGTELWSYSLDGTNFSSLGSITPGSGVFASRSLNLSSLSGTALDNQGTFYVRMTIGTGTSASYAFDNIQLTGTAVSTIPEPSTYALLGGVGALGLVLAARRKRA